MAGGRRDPQVVAREQLPVGVSHRIGDAADLEGRRKLIARELGARAAKLDHGLSFVVVGAVI